MNDIIIKKKHIKREMVYFIICVLVMEIINGVSIYIYNGKWIELIMSIGYVCVAGFVLYISITIIRLICYTIFCRSKKN